MMSYRSISGIVGAGIITLAGCQTEVQPPNIILIMTDDQGFGDFGFTGNEIVETPVLDQFKEEATMFDRFYVSPVCAPTRASLLTGRYHLRTGTTWVTHGKETMRPEEKTLAESLGEHGYVTGCFGKWHNGEHYPHHPNGQGFDTFFGFTAGHWNNYFDTKLEYNGEELVTEGYIADVLTDSSLAFIERNSDKPFFCYVPYNTPHAPFQVADEYFDKYKAKGMDDMNAAVYGMCENIDFNVGRILDKLDELKLSENTIVIFLTDNGPNGWRYNAGMKGKKGWVDEGGVRVPLLIRYPGVVPEGNTIYGLSAHIDLLPTIHSLAGLEFEEYLPLDGIDLSSYMLNGETIPDRLIFTHQVHNTLSPTPVSVRSPGYRLVINSNGDTSLYNMISDPGQKNNIAKLEPEMTASLADTTEKWYTEVVRDLPYQPGIPVGYPEAPEVHLPAPEAELSGDVKFHAEKGWANDWLVDFQAGDHQASWNLDVKQGGSYEVYLNCSAEPFDDDENIIVQANEHSTVFSIDKRLEAPEVKSPDRVVRGEVKERVWPQIYIGDLSLSEGDEKLSISFHGDIKHSPEIKSIILKQKL
ncbi:arylsulfatase [Bacteroidota bacterium]